MLPNSYIVCPWVKYAIKSYRNAAFSILIVQIICSGSWESLDLLFAIKKKRKLLTPALGAWPVLHI